MPAGNVYYYFKTKEELAEASWWSGAWRSFAQPGQTGTAEFSEGAAVGFRGERSPQPRSNWRTEDALLKRAVHGVAQGGRRTREEIRGASPMSPCVGLRSSSGPLAMKRIHENSRVHLFSAFQGMAAVALGTNDREVVVMETKRLKASDRDIADTQSRCVDSRSGAAALDPRGVAVKRDWPRSGGYSDAKEQLPARKGEEAVKGMKQRTPLGYWASDRPLTDELAPKLKVNK